MLDKASDKKDGERGLKRTKEYVTIRFEQNKKSESDLSEINI